MRKLTIFLAVIVIVGPVVIALYPPPLLAAEDPCNDRETGQVVLCDPSRKGASSSAVYISLPTNSGSVTNTGSSGSASSKTYVPYNRLSTGPDGEPCATTGYVEQGANPPDERLLIDPNPRESNIPTSGNDLSILANYPPCPSRPPSPGEPAPLETRAMTAARIWERIPLPKPRPWIAPGRAITGKLAYLETRGETIHTYYNDTTFGPLQIVATGTYTVSWGDGTTTGPHPYEGTAWPTGRISHDYVDVGRYDVIVSEKWTATWSLDGESGVLRTLQTNGRIEDFLVEQIQAVVG